MNRKQFTQYIKENIKEILSEAVAVEFTGKTGKKSLQSVPNIGAANSLKAQNPNIASVAQLEEMSLNEMAKIAGALDAAIRKVIEDNPDLEGLPLKKAIKGSEKVKDALDTDELYDNQLNKFIALVKGQRELGKKGRKPLEKSDEPKKEEPKAKKEAPKKEAPKKEAPKKEKKAKDEDDEEVEDNWNKSSDDDGMEDEKSIDKKAQAVAKKGGSNLTKLNNITTQLKDLEKEMKGIADNYKKAEGSKKETLLSQLKEKTKAKKELEKLQDKLAADVV
jgi:hypothetical protein